MTSIDFSTYESGGFFDEMFNTDGSPKPHYALFLKRIQQMGWKKLNYLQHATDRAQLSMGMTFNVYSDDEGVEKILHLENDAAYRSIISNCLRKRSRATRKTSISIKLCIGNFPPFISRFW